jgi:hypothetical protein
VVFWTYHDSFVSPNLDGISQASVSVRSGSGSEGSANLSICSEASSDARATRPGARSTAEQEQQGIRRQVLNLVLQSVQIDGIRRA